MRGFFHRNYVLFLITFISAIGFCAISFLSVMQFSYQSEEQYIATCNERIVSEIETSLAFGKKLSNYYGIDQVLEKAKELLPENAVIVVEDANGDVIAATAGEEHFTIAHSDFGVVEQELKKESGEPAGRLFTYYEKAQVLARIKDAFYGSLIGSLVCVALLILLTAVIDRGRRLDGTHIAAILTVGILIQGAFLTVNYANEFEDAALQNIKGVASYVGASVSNLTDKGVAIEEINDLNAFFEKVQKANSAIEDIQLDKMKNVQDDGHAYIESISSGGREYAIIFSVSEDSIRMTVIRMILMFAATSFLSVIIMRESLTLSDMIAFRKSEAFNTVSDEQFDVIAKTVRYGNFLSLTFDYMCLSFSALQIKQWNEGVWVLSPAMAAAMSISINQIADLLGMVAMPSISRKIRGKYLMLISAALVIFANVNCFLTGSAAVMIFMRFIAGIGTAGTKQVRNMVIAQGYENEAQRNANLAASNNGVIGGLLCGMGLGSVIAGSINYQATFLVAGIGFVLYLIFEAWCIPWELLATREAGSLAEDVDSNLFVRILSIFRSFSVWRTMFLIVVPQYFLLMIIVCLIPGRTQSLNMHGVVLTYANLLNGVIGLYVGERLLQLLQKFVKTDLRIYIIMLLVGAAALMIMDIPAFPVVMILVSASLSGIVDGVGSPVATDIFMGNAYVIRYLNDTEILMLYSVIGSAVMAVAPFLLELCERSIPWMYGTGVALICFAVLLIPEAGGAKKKSSKRIHKS